jgi:exocyst complex component 6
MMNENAVSNILIDVDFLDEELKRIGRSHLAVVFSEIRMVSSAIPAERFRADRLSCKTASIPLNNTVQEYLVPANRQSSYAAVKPKRLQTLLDKLARYGSSQRDPGQRELAEKRRREADAVGRVFPGENR